MVFKSHLSLERRRKEELLLPPHHNNHKTLIPTETLSKHNHPHHNHTTINMEILSLPHNNILPKEHQEQHLSDKELGWELLEESMINMF